MATDQKNNKSFLDWLNKENQISKENNVIFAERAFFTNSAMRWIISRQKQGLISEGEVSTHINTLRSFLKKELDLCWDNGKICIKQEPSSVELTTDHEEGDG
jgi:hypothetical protein